MIATLNGEISEKLAEVVVLNVGGVGYGVFVTSEDYGKLKTGDNTKLYIYEHIRESNHDLFGFSRQETKKLFELLLGVNGVGPKMALGILSLGNSDEVKQAIAGGDVKFIQSSSGVGKKVAERVVVDLKDKVGLASADLGGILMSNETVQKDDAIQALVSLGYDTTDAMELLKDVPADLSTEDRVKQALRAVK